MLSKKIDCTNFSKYASGMNSQAEQYQGPLYHTARQYVVPVAVTEMSFGVFKFTSGT